MDSYVFLGPPGVGKGSLGELFSKRRGLVHISTGALFREEMSAESSLGKQVKELVAAGTLVPDELVSEMLGKRISQEDVMSQGGLLDGYPRTLQQADMLQKILEGLGRSLAAVVLIDADKELLLTRLTSRRICTNKECAAIYNIQTNPPKVENICDRCSSALYQRADDSMETALERLKIYEEQTAPLIDYYKKLGLLVVTKSEDVSVEENYEALQAVLEKHKR